MKKKKTIRMLSGYNRWYSIMGRKKKLNLRLKKMLFKAMVLQMVSYDFVAWRYAMKTRRKLLRQKNMSLLYSADAPCFIRDTTIFRDIPEVLKTKARKAFAKLDNNPKRHLR